MNGHPIDRRSQRLLVALLCLGAASCDRAGPGGTDGPGPGTGAAPGEPWFHETAAVAGLRFEHESGHEGPHLFPEIVCGGAALFDLDGDGDLDAYLVQSGRITDPPERRPPNRLYRNRGDGTFDALGPDSGGDDRGYGVGVASGDYDGDGDTDLYVTNVGANVLLRNDGGRLVDVTEEAGVGEPGWSTSAAFVDHDADGDLDLLVINYINWSIAAEHTCYDVTGAEDYCDPAVYGAPAQDRLYRNEGDGRFVDVTEAAGLHGAFGTGLGVATGDFDGDGRVDLFVANDGMKNQLWINQGDGSFRDRAAATGCAVDSDGRAKAGMGVAVADIDDDDDLDLLVVNLRNESDSLYRNELDYFIDDTRTAGLGTVSRQFTRFGVALLDFDNDGRLDLYEANGRVTHQTSSHVADPFAEPNLLMRGTADGRFVEVRPRGGTAAPLVYTSRAAAFGDIDDDGGIDVLVANRDGPTCLLRNIHADRGHWLGLRVREDHGGNAIGATVTASVGSRRITRDVRTAYSYCAANDPRVHIGLGAETAVTEVVVRWVDGQRERFPDLEEVDRYVELRRGEGLVE